MHKKMGLGKGLGALIQVQPENTENALIDIPVSDVRPNLRQPRLRIDEERLKELADSIQENGLVQPVVVREIPGGGYELIAGERRWRACQMAGLQYIQAVVKNFGDLEAAAVALIENLQREDLNPLEEAVAYQRLMKEFGLTQEVVSQRVGKSRPQVANMLRLLSLPNEIQALMADGKLSAGHGRALLGLVDKQCQIELADKIIKRDLSVRETEELVRKLTSDSKPRLKPAINVDPNINSIEEQLRNILGTKVKIKGKSKGGGKIEIEYYDDMDLERILEVLDKDAG